MSSRLFPFWWLVAPEVVTIFTVYSHVIDGSFSSGDSLIGGAQTIDGLVLYAYVVNQDTVNDDYEDMDLWINGIDTSINGCVMDRDGDYVGLGDALAEGTRVDFGWAYDFFRQGGEAPHTSYNVKAKRTGTFKKTVKVVVIHRQAT